MIEIGRIKIFLSVTKRSQILQYMKKVNLINHPDDDDNDLKEMNLNSDKVVCVKAALTAGCYPHVIRIDKKNHRLLTEYFYKNFHFINNTNYNLNYKLRKESQVKINFNSVVSNLVSTEQVI